MAELQVDILDRYPPAEMAAEAAGKNGRFRLRKAVMAARAQSRITRKSCSFIRDL